MIDDKLIWSITKMYNQAEFNPNESSLGYKIDVYQESINKYFTEYLVNFEYFKNLMISYGFSLLTPEECKNIGLKQSIGSFSLLYNDMVNKIKRKHSLKNKYGEATNMSEQEKDISFLNNYFIFKKTNKVADDNVYNVNTIESVSEGKTQKLNREMIKQIMAERIQKVFIKKFRKKIIIRMGKKK